MKVRNIGIDPSSFHYEGDKLFDLTDELLNRDDTLLPFYKVKILAESKDCNIHTADYFTKNKSRISYDHYSLGMLRDFKYLQEKGASLKAFMIFEPPVVAPRLYEALPELTSFFDRVYVHNTNGAGYSLKTVDTSKLYKLYWPQPRVDVISHCWTNLKRQRRIVVVNGNHRPNSDLGELYSKRIQSMVELSKFGMIDLYGRGWEKWWSPSSQWIPYWKNRKSIMSIFKGYCESKYETLSNYDFALCYENMEMQGYVSEKIFDCFYAGTIPLYLGANDISEFIPNETFVDCRKFTSIQEVVDFIENISHAEIIYMKEAARQFLRGPLHEKFYNSINNVLFP